MTTRRAWGVSIKGFDRSSRPDVSIRLPPLYLRKNEERRIRAGHLWVYSNEVDPHRSRMSDFDPGDAVAVVDHRGKWLGNGYVNPRSLICARVVSRTPGAVLGPELLAHRLQAALALRERLYRAPYYRWVFGETDGLPGLVVDRYADIVVVQINTAGMERVRTDIVAAIEAIANPAGILLRNDVASRTLEGLDRYTEHVSGSIPETIELEENGARFAVSLERGHKTGWYFDQRDNRQRLAALVAGRRVLDVFSYVGGWGVAAAVHGASDVTCVDSSTPALELARHNAALNDVGDRVRTVEADAFDALAAFRSEPTRYDVIVLDPPAFIKRRRDIDQGALAYRRLNLAALRLLADDGILVTCSCSYHLSREQFTDALRRSALKAARAVQIFAEGQQAADHPVHPAMPETRYLKAHFARAIAPF